jgi:hypothetical protein
MHSSNASPCRANNRTSNYLISTDKNGLDKASSGFIGKLRYVRGASCHSKTSLPSLIPGILFVFYDLHWSRSNFVGTEFVVFDQGVNPKDAGSAVASAVSSTSVRQELASVIYVCVSRILHTWFLSHTLELVE